MQIELVAGFLRKKKGRWCEMNEISMITCEAKFLRYQDAMYAFWTDNLRLAGKGKTDKAS